MQSHQAASLYWCYSQSCKELVCRLSTGFWKLFYQNNCYVRPSHHYIYGQHCTALLSIWLLNNILQRKKTANVKLGEGAKGGGKKCCNQSDGLGSIIKWSLRVTITFYYAAKSISDWLQHFLSPLWHPRLTLHWQFFFLVSVCPLWPHTVCTVSFAAPQWLWVVTTGRLHWWPF